MSNTLAPDVRGVLEVYLRCIEDMIVDIQHLDAVALSTVRDAYTEDEDCRSIASLLAHVVCSGHGYIVSLRRASGEKVDYPVRRLRDTPMSYIADLRGMHEAALRFFEQRVMQSLLEMEELRSVTVPSGRVYDVEQLMEHAIVHVLRHQRQLRRFLATDDAR